MELIVMVFLLSTVYNIHLLNQEHKITLLLTYDKISHQILVVKVSPLSVMYCKILIL